jgi:hypothetical protein
MVVVAMTTPINSPRGAERRRLAPVVTMVLMRWILGEKRKWRGVGATF